MRYKTNKKTEFQAGEAGVAWGLIPILYMTSHLKSEMIWITSDASLWQYQGFVLVCKCIDISFALSTQYRLQRR